MTSYGITLEPGEDIRRVIHRHPITVLRQIVAAGLLIVLAIAVTYVDTLFTTRIPIAPIILLVIIVIVLGAAGVNMAIGLYLYRHNVLIFTTRHLVIVEQPALFRRTVSQISFDRVQDVTGSRNGLLATMLNFGNVEVQSAGEQEKFIFHDAPDPEAVAAQALELHDHPAPAAE